MCVRVHVCVWRGREERGEGERERDWVAIRLSVLKFHPPASPPHSRLREDAEAQLQRARCGHSAGVLVSVLTPVCLERSGWAVKLCGTLLSFGAGGEVAGTAGQGIQIQYLLPTPQWCSSALSSQ